MEVDRQKEFILGMDISRDCDVNEIEASMMDYDYVQKCNDVGMLKSILNKLVLGKQGRYPHLEETIVEKILSLLPENQRKKIAYMSTDLCQDDIRDHREALDKWIECWNEGMEELGLECNENDDQIFQSKAKPKTFNAHGIPSIRHATGKQNRIITSSVSHKQDTLQTLENISNQNDGNTTIIDKISKENLSNRDYFKAWDKFDVEAAVREVDSDGGSIVKVKDDNKEKSCKNSQEIEERATYYYKNDNWQKVIETQTTRSMKELDETRKQLQYSNLSAVERRFMASREKSKGNEFFRNKEYEPSFECYTKSLALDDQDAIVYANRAMVCIRLSNMCQAASDCTQAVTIDPSYTKALARRGMVHFKCGRYLEASKDFTSCVNKEPSNTEYQMFLNRSAKKNKEVNGNEMFEKSKKKIVIVQDDDDDSIDSKSSDVMDVIEEVYTPGARCQ